MALPTVRDSTSGATRNVSSMVVTLPTKQSGDLLIIFAASDKELQTLSGWALMRDNQLDAYGRDYAYFYKISDGTEANPTLVSSTSNFSGLAWVALSLTGGISLSSLPGGAVDVNYDAETYVAQQDNINCLYDNALLVQFVMSHNNNVGTTLTTANGWTELEDVVEPSDGIIGIWAGSKTVTAAGAQTAPVVTVSGGTNATDLLTFHFIDNNEVPVKQAFTGGDPQVTNTVSGPIFLRCINPKYDWLFIFGANAVDANWNTSFAPVFGTTVFHTLGIGSAQEDLAVKYGKMTADTSVYSIGTSAFYSTSAFILRGGHETDPIARTGYSWERANSTTPTVPSLKTTHANQLHLVFCGCDYGTTASSMAASGYTTLYRGGDGVNNGIAFAAYKEYTTGGEDTSCSITNAYSHQQLVYSVLITPRGALKSDLPAFVRFATQYSTGMTGSVTLYNCRAKDDDILLLFAGCKDTTSAIDFTLTTPSLTLTALESEYDATHGWNIKLKMAQLTAATSGDTIVMNFSTNYSTSSIYAVFVERAIPESAERRAEAKSTTTTTTLTVSLDLPDTSVGVAFAYVPAQLSDVNGDFCEQCSHYELAANNISTSLIIDGSPDSGDGSHVFTADVTGKMYVAYVSLASSIGGAGLFFGQDF